MTLNRLEMLENYSFNEMNEWKYFVIISQSALIEGVLMKPKIV